MLEEEEQKQKQGQVSPHCSTLGHHSSPVLGALPYSPRQLDNSHADWIFVRIRARSTNFASLGSSAYPQAERDPPPVLPGLRWAHFQWLSTRGKFEHQMRWRERARGLERGPRGSQVCQNMSRQPAAELRSYGRQLRRISLPLFPTPPSRSGWGRGGDVRAPPRPRLPGADRVLQLQSASQPVAAKNAQAAASFPAAVISLAAAVPTKKCPSLSSPRSLGTPPSAGFFVLTSGSASQGPPLRSPPRLPHRVPRRFPRLGLQVMLFLFCSRNSSQRVRVACPGFCWAEARSVSASLLDDSDFVVLQLLEM